MRKVKIILWVILIGIIGFAVYQNKIFFMTKHKFIFEFPLIDKYSTPELTNAVIISIFFLIGLLISYFYYLYKHFKLSKAVKKLTAENNTLRTENTALKEEITAFTKQYDSSQNNRSDSAADAAIKEDSEQEENLTKE